MSVLHCVALCHWFLEAAVCSVHARIGELITNRLCAGIS
jgi:hypothetical protein